MAQGFTPLFFQGISVCQTGFCLRRHLHWTSKKGTGANQLGKWLMYTLQWWKGQGQGAMNPDSTIQML